MKQARYTFNFCIKKTRLASDGKAPIYLRVTIDTDRKEKSTNLFVTPGEWDQGFGLSRGKDKYSLSLNERLTVIRSKMLEAYEFYLKTKPEQPCCHNTTMKYLRNFGKIVRIAVQRKYIASDPFEQKSLKLEEVYPEFLEEHELTAVINKNFKTDRLRQTRDVFVFCCYTGLAFSDVKELSKTHICEDNDTLSWIKKKRHKTQIMCSVPLMEQAVSILAKYRNKVKGGYLLPVLCNQKYNEYLKEIAELCGIEKEISTHSARHTFATLALNNGVALHNVAKMLGHSNIKMTQRYARVLDRSVKRDMENLQSVISGLSAG